MADIDNMVKWIPLTFLVFAVFTVISALYVGGLTDITGNIGEYDRGKFRLGVVMENTVTTANNLGDSDFNYNRRRGAIPKKMFTNQISRSDKDKIGYAIEDGKCYIPGVVGLDGKNFGFYIPQNSLGNNDASTRCDIQSTNPRVSAPVTLVSDDGKFHNKKEVVELTIYEIE